MKSSKRDLERGARMWREDDVSKRYARKPPLDDPRQDRFDKADAALMEARKECERTWTIWHDACERLRRIERERNQAWAAIISDFKMKVSG